MVKFQTLSNRKYVATSPYCFIELDVINVAVINEGFYYLQILFIQKYFFNYGIQSN